MQPIVAKFILVVIVIFALLLSSFNNITYAGEYQKLLLISSKTGGFYQRFNNAFNQAIINNGLSVNTQVTVSNLENLPPLNNKNTKDTLIVTVGSKAAKFISEKTINAPIINVMLPFSVYQKIVKKNQSCARQSAIYIDQPIQRQLALSKQIFPDRKDFGFLLGKTSQQRYLLEKPIFKLAKKFQHVQLILESRELAWSLRSLSNIVDIFIAINDPLVLNFNNAKWLLYMAYQQGLPVIGFSKPYVKAGASAAVYSTPEQIAEQTVTMVKKHQQLSAHCLSQPQYPQKFKVAINKAVIESLSGKLISEQELQKKLYAKENKHK